MSYVRGNFVDAGLAGALTPKPFRDGWTTATEFDQGELNTRRLRALLEDAQYRAANPVRVYIPEGRYYLGLTGSDPASEQMADLLVPAHVTLVFGPKATLVPLAYTAEEIRSRGLRDQRWIDRRREELPDEEALRVRIEIQGRIEADLDKIFDPFLEDDRGINGAPSTVVPTRRGGAVFFTRDNLRAVYPEWWGAVPKRGDDTPLSRADVRRTTVAIQSCFDAVLHHRINLKRSSVTRDRQGREAPTGSRPSTDVIFANDYVIDRPVRLGMTLARARVMAGLMFTGDEYPFHDIGVSIRGLCGPAKGRNGAALLRASSDFEPEDPAPGMERSSLLGDSWSLMIVRTTAPVSIENVVFDAAPVLIGNVVSNTAVRVERCLTVMSFIPSTHHHSLEGCTFRNAKYAQLYIGGELPTVVGQVPGRYFSGGQDLGDMRVSRCLFEMGDSEGLSLPRPLFNKPPLASGGFWRHGVVYRSEPGLGTEFHGCVFRGRASPMFLGLGGRVSFQDCSFDTDVVMGNPDPSPGTRPDHVGLRGWNGTDLYLGVGASEFFWDQGVAPPSNGPSQPVQQTMLTARNVVSRSRQFLATHPNIDGVRTNSFLSFASVTLLHVRHRSRFPDERPGIYWGASRLHNCALVMEGCVFDTPASRGSVRGSVFISPIRPLDGDTDSNLSPVLVIASRRGPEAGPLLTTNLGIGTIPNVMLVAATPR